MRAVLWLYRNHSNLEQRLSSPTAGRCLTQRESVTAGSYGLSPPTALTLTAGFLTQAGFLRCRAVSCAATHHLELIFNC